MDDKYNTMINMMKEVQSELKEMNTEDEAITFLLDKTKLSDSDCKDAYDFLMKLDLDSIK